MNKGVNMVYVYEVEKISNDKAGSEFYVAMSKSLRGCVGQGARYN